MKIKKTWIEKLHDAKGLPKIENMKGHFAEKFGEGTMILPAPIEIYEIMARVPEGKVTTTGIIRDLLARKHQTTTACPLMTGIFAWIAAHAAEEYKDKGKYDTPPYWRTLKENGEINGKFPGGCESQIRLLAEEGHQIIQKGKKFYIQNYKSLLFTGELN